MRPTKAAILMMITDLGPQPPWWRFLARRRWWRASHAICDVIAADTRGKMLQPGAVSADLMVATKRWLEGRERGF
jgi:hypothetical protein